MNKEVLKDLITLKLKTIDKIIDSLSEDPNNTIRKSYDCLIEVINETTEDYIKERKESPRKNKGYKKIKKIEIE